MSLLVATRRPVLSSYDNDMAAKLKIGLVGTWPLEEASGTRRDHSGLGNGLTDNATVTGNPGPSLNIPLASQFVQANLEYLSIADNDFLSIPNVSFHISFFAYLDSLGTNEMFLVSKANTTVGEYEIIQNGTNFKAYLWKSDLTVNTAVTATNFGSLSATTWYKVDVWYDLGAATWNISVNNTASNSSAVSAGNEPSNTAADFTIGRTLRTSAGTSFADGRIADVVMRKNIPTAQERTWHYSGGGGRSLSQLRVGA